MTMFLNLDTNEFPRFEGDIALNPDANWIEVIQTQMPNLADDEMAYQIEPKLIDGQYFQQWTIRKKTLEEMKPIKEQLENL